MTETSHTISPWRLDRSITLGVILALTLQTAGALMWTGAANERLSLNPARMRLRRWPSVWRGWKRTRPIPAPRSNASSVGSKRTEVRPF